MKYFFILGSNKALSLAELISVLPEARNGELVNSSVFVVDIKNILDAQSLIKKLGGIIKIGEIQGEAKMYSSKMTGLIGEMLEPGEGKYKYGISNYAKFASPKKDKMLAMNIKKILREEGTSVRWVTSKEAQLSSVVVEQNLMKNGIEIVLCGDYKKCFVARTLAVQDFKGLSKRDYGRPGRDDLSGMLPPKLAQILINISQAKTEQVVFDPFCGSGTVLTEAMLMGYKDLLGTDQSEKAVHDTEVNIKWLKKKYDLGEVEAETFVCDAKDLLEELDKNSIDIIVTEPYLGPQRGFIDNKKVQSELSGLYSEVLSNFYKLLKTGGRVVMIWPVRVDRKEQIFLNVKIGKFNLINILDQNLASKFKQNFSRRGNLLYGREGQKVWREIVVLEKR